MILMRARSCAHRPRPARYLARRQLVDHPEPAHLTHLADLRLEVGDRTPCRTSLFASFALPRHNVLFASSIMTARRPCRNARRPLGMEHFEPLTFSPTPANLIGAPVTRRTESAAPPRASPSSLVNTTPVSATHREGLAVFTAS
jgi:hypothetical protein